MLALALGAKTSNPMPLQEHGVTVVFIESPNSKVELLEPLGKNSPIKKFLEKNPNGGMHHICYEVINLKNASEKLELAGARILGDGKPKIGAHGNPVLFLHPADFAGTLFFRKSDRENNIIQYHSDIKQQNHIFYKLNLIFFYVFFVPNIDLDKI